MIDPVVLLAFIPAALALNLTPGADMMFCLGQGLRAGSKPAIAASAGISTGSMIHVALAGLGLSAVVAAVPWAFDVIRWVGVAYLLYLAWGAFRHGAVPSGTEEVATARAFRTGLYVNLTNPKVILFVLAFIPQFVDPAEGPVFLQFLIFGAIIAVGGFLINGAVGVFAGGAGRMLTGSPRAGRILGYLSGTIFAALAVRLAVLERS
ncbi:LysE family translocator [Aestuariivita boseongensis]|uniref:LysE family translocator n=1 Tax=Aestuariivita boseongensis TaxID=1470562 RepID=UPI00067FF1EE|nr:LysE family translocator [Aestuariivita boseongensis]